MRIATGSLQFLLQHFHYALLNWDFEIHAIVDNLQISGYFRPILFIEWEEFSVRNKLTNPSISINEHVSLSFFQRLQLQQIHNQPLIVYIY